MDFPRHPFWDFSIDVHKKEGIHEACLQLQEGFELDINVLFFCCWAGASGGMPLSEGDMTKILRGAGSWQEDIVRPIWRARWLLKGGFEGYPDELVEQLRKDLVTSEVHAEHIEQIHLAGLVPLDRRKDRDARQRLAAASGNLGEYLRKAVLSGDRAQAGSPRPRPLEGLLEPLSVILLAVFPDVSREAVTSKLREIIPLGGLSE
jgi:uncharacterized protein (TIGR02444 family)